MNTPTLSLGARRRLVAAGMAVSLLCGCSTMVGRPTRPLTTKRDEPGVALCMSERTNNGGIRIVGKLNVGIYPITGATIQYRSADPADAVPATAANAGRDLELTGAHSEKVPYRKGSGEVAFVIDAGAARNLQDKVLWYRWIIDYDNGGSGKRDVTAVHRTSLEEAGLPRAADTPGPDSSVALAGDHRH